MMPDGADRAALRTRNGEAVTARLERAGNLSNCGRAAGQSTASSDAQILSHSQELALRDASTGHLHRQPRAPDPPNPPTEDLVASAFPSIRQATRLVPPHPPLLD